MIRVLTVKNINEIIQKVTLKNFFLKLIDQLKRDFARWHEFEKAPRHATHVPDGMIELMPIADKEYYACKYVNAHPNNTKHHKMTVIGIGLLANARDGYPVLISEMTLLTALRTAATSTLASQYLAKKDVKTFGIIGTGAQSEFQALAHHFALGINEFYYFDIDSTAMDKFRKNLELYPIELHQCKDGHEVLERSDIITTATAQKGHHKILEKSWLKKGLHINKIGGDSPGKTELDPNLIKECKIVVEFLEQTKVEGEIQQIDQKIYAELWELAKGEKKGRESQHEITLFDSVGFAIEDYSTLRLINELSESFNLSKLDMIPEIADPKNLFGILK